MWILQTFLAKVAWFLSNKIIYYLLALFLIIVFSQLDDLLLIVLILIKCDVTGKQVANYLKTC